MPAAVLIPLVTRDQGVSILLTQRAAHLYDHAGQISFPGGRIETSDPTPEDAAARGARGNRIAGRACGSAGQHAAVSDGERILHHPRRVLVRPGFQLAPDAFEVAEVFEVPLSFLMDPANHRLYEARLDDGRVRHYYGMPYGKYFIWGATAGMLRNLYHLLNHGLQPR